MNANCKLCGAPLKKGNIKVVRPRGKKRPFRVCRVCPPVQVAAILDGTDALRLVRPQVLTGGPFVVEGVLDVPPPPRYRFFMTQEQAERVKRTVKKSISTFGVSFEVIPVPEDQVEADPESFAELVEVTVDWKVE